MICPNCRASMPDWANFCTSCGSRLRQAAPTSATGSMHKPTPASTPQSDADRLTEELTAVFRNGRGTKAAETGSIKVTAATDSDGEQLEILLLDGQDCPNGVDIPYGSTILDKSIVSRMEDGGFLFQNAHLLTEIEFSRFKITDSAALVCMFDGCTNLHSLDLRCFNTERIGSFEDMFKDCSSLKTLDLRGWYIRHDAVTKGMFDGCRRLQTVDMRGCDAGTIGRVRYELSQAHINARVIF